MYSRYIYDVVVCGVCQKLYCPINFIFWRDLRISVGGVLVYVARGSDSWVWWRSILWLKIVMKHHFKACDWFSVMYQRIPHPLQIFKISVGCFMSSESIKKYYTFWGWFVMSCNVLNKFRQLWIQKLYIYLLFWAAHGF